MSNFLPSRRRFLGQALATGIAAGFARRSWAQAGPLATTNETIQAAHQAALAVLQPSERDLRHGLALHAESIVFDSYGFAPRAAVDAAATNAAIEAGATAEELADLREEQTMLRYAVDERERKEFFEAFTAAGVTCIFENAGEEGNDPLRLIKRLARYTYATDVLKDVLPKAVRPADVRRAKADGKICLAMTTNGVPLRHEWESVRDELRLVRIFHQLGVRMMHLTYNRRNPLGDGCGEPHDGGLSDFGRAAVAEMNRVGVIVDVAHTGWRTSREAAQASTKPMLASHTVCNGVHEHFRGKPDDTIKAICDTGGLVGVCCIPRFLGGKGDISALLDHVDYLVKKFGPDHAAIGTDVAYISRNTKSEQEKITKTKPAGAPRKGDGARWEHLWPDDDYRETADAVKSIAWTNWPLFTVGLVQRGHSDDVIRKIVGENMLRVWTAQVQ